MHGSWRFSSALPLVPAATSDRTPFLTRTISAPFRRRMLFSREIPGEEERAYINALVTGVRDHREELDDLIEQFSHGWKLSRISRTALAVLRVAL